MGEADLEDALGTAQPGFMKPAKAGFAQQTGLLLPSAGKIPNGYFQTGGGVSVLGTEIVEGFVLLKVGFFPV